MFSEMLAEIHSNTMPEPGILLKRFDFAMTKKLGIIKLPPPFWMRDPKINPPVEHLFWAGLLLKDRNRIELALSVLAVEIGEKASVKKEIPSSHIDDKARSLVEELLGQFPDAEIRNQFARDLCEVVPEWLDCQV